MKKRLIILMALPLSACIQLKSPENLVSDTYRTGKEIYKDIAGTGGEQMFVHEIVVAEGSELQNEKIRCVDELVSTTRKNHDIESYKVSRLVHDVGDTETIYCEIGAVFK